MSVLMRRPTLFRQGNFRLLRYLGGTKNFELSKLIHARFIEVSSRDNILDQIDLYPKWGPLGFAHHVDHASEVAKMKKLRASDQERSHNMLSDMVGDMEDLSCDPPELDTCRYDFMLVGFTKKGYLDEALIILRRKLLPEHRLWNTDTYIGIFGLCARLKDLNLGRQVHNKLLKSYVVESDEDKLSICNALIKMYGKCKEILTARKVFDTCRPLKNVVIWNTIFAAYSESLEFDMPLKGFIKMRREDDVNPNESTFCILLTASTELHSLRYGKLLHALTFKTGFKGCKKLEDTLINMYSRTGDIKAAENVFLGMTTDYIHDTTTWNAMICGYSLHSYGNKALALFQEMLKLGEDDPDEETFVGVLNACGHLGHVEEGFYYLYEVMKQKGVEPGLEHYMCIINMLIKAGELNEALSFIVSKPSKWDAFAWSTFLRGCYAYQNYALGIRVAELIPDDVASKVSKWFGATQVSEVMETMDTEEEGRQSWIQINNDTEGFDSIHKRDPIKFGRSLETMSKFLFCITHSLEKDDTDLENVIRRHHDCVHSEELAIVYAAVHGAKNAPICIIKTSGEICGKCHSLMKLTSKALPSRPLMVRDANQFHNFREGHCSCADYW